MNIRYFLPKLGDDNVQKILFFIRKRINLIESLLGSNDIINALDSNDKIRNYLIELSTSDNPVLNNIDLDKVFEKPNIRQIIDSLEIDKLIFNAILRNNLELVYKIIKLNLPLNVNMGYQGKSILEAILSIRVSNIYSYLFLRIITNLKRLGFVYEIVNVLQNIRVNNIDLYNEIKKILGIPNLTYDTLLLDRVSTYSGEYITNEILINPNLIKEINNNRNGRGQSLLYIYCSFRLQDGLLSYILRVNEILKEYVIDVNIQNKESLSTPLHGLLWHGINGINDIKAFGIKFRFYKAIDLLKRNNLNINIKNKHDLTPIQELYTKEDIPPDVKDKIKEELTK